MSQIDDQVVIDEIRSPLGTEWATMTFPAFRYALSLAGTEEEDGEGRRTLACGATRDGVVIGLALAQRAPTVPPTVEILSLFVVRDLRGHGIATRLLSCLEEAARRSGAVELSGSYMTGRPSLEALERVFVKRGFDQPVLRRLIFKFTPEQAAQCRWFKQARLPTGASIFKWSELTAADMDDLKQGQAERHWIHPKLEPWHWDRNFDPASSVGMRKDGEIVGWAINHRLTPGLVTFTTAFMRADLARRGASFPLYVASLMPLMGSGLNCVFMTDATDFAAMARFMLRRGAPFAGFTGETRGVSKRLT